MSKFNKFVYEQKKYLFIVPGENAIGGIKNYYYSLKNIFNLHVDYFERGSRKQPYRESKLKEVFRALSDLIKFILKITFNKYELVQVSPSMSLTPIFRDAFFIIFAKLFRIKVIVFFHGWHISSVKKIEKKYLSLFKMVYFKSDAFIVLGSSFKSKLIEWGYKKNIYIETTTVNQDLLNGIEKDFIKEKHTNINKKDLKILFLASYVSRNKGIYETLDAYILLKQKYPNLSLTVVGGDSLNSLEYPQVKEYVSNKKANDVFFTGYIESLEGKITILKNHDIYIFPSYTEGMPISLLEALAAGLPSITTPVGGIPDIFNSGEHGFLVDVKNILKIVKHTELLINDGNLRRDIALNNFNFARERFSPKKIVERFEKIITET